ncbi:MAG: hypothetical protein EOO64_00305 [Massilia sp.]|nr:MAG: hypothetical protein EOO64_00305 [Massilia sp.]
MTDSSQYLADFIRGIAASIQPGEELREILEIKRYEMGSALTISRPDLLQPLSKAISEMVTDGTLDALVKRYRVNDAP